ncbi:centrosomal protein of 70 kDa isoform 2-T2 [Synchiropus picturatus]
MSVNFSQSDERTYVYMWTSKQFQLEQRQWEDLNKVLQHHGFKPLSFADPVENKKMSDLVLLDKKAAGEIRTTLRMMLSDSERRQALIQELIKNNNQFKEDIQEHVKREAKLLKRTTELEGLLDGMKIRVQDLEERFLGKAMKQRSQTQQLLEEKLDQQKRCQAMELKLSEQKKEVNELQRKLHFTVKEEELRLSRQRQVFKHICTNVIQQDTAESQQLVDVIDFYESKLAQLQGSGCPPQGCAVMGDQSSSKPSSSITPAFKSVLKAYRQQQKDTKKQLEELKNELRTRLENKDRTTGRTEASTGPGEAATCADYLQLLREFSAILNDSDAPLQLSRQKPPSSDSSQLVEFQALLPKLELWAQQVHLLADLQHNLLKLSARLAPWQATDGNPAAAVKVEDMVQLVDNMLEHTPQADEKELVCPTRHTLLSMVSHFQKLFDVASISGVFPRMNELYMRLGEVTNAMRNLRDVLQLESSAAPAEVVNAVARLVTFTEDTSGLQDVLGDADLDSVIQKVKQHEEFFPAFHSLVLDIFHILGVSRLGEVVPAVQSLKQRAT